MFFFVAVAFDAPSGIEIPILVLMTAAAALLGSLLGGILGVVGAALYIFALQPLAERWQTRNTLDAQAQ